MIWIPDKEETWIAANILGVDDAKSIFVCETINRKVKQSISKSLVHPVDPSHLLDLDNLCFMNNMHEAPLLDLLRRRFFDSKIYTYTGDVLISLNPYKSISGLYDNPLKYLNLLDEKDRLNSSLLKQDAEEIVAPHVFKIANNALKSMVSRKSLMSIPVDSTPQNTKSAVSFGDLEDDTPPNKPSLSINTNQSIIISGESGAGKTEASKVVMNFLIQANKVIRRHVKADETASTTEKPFSTAKPQKRGSILLTDEEKSASQIGKDDAFAANITAVLLDSSVVFESFGNAKTVRNDNSSRFGKYIKLLYNNADNTIVSAVTETFLLEKSRLVSVGQDERNYHVFYQLVRSLAAADKELAKDLQLLQPVESFRMLTEGNCTVVTTEEEDRREFLATQKALLTGCKCTKTEIDETYSLLAIILHFGNIDTSSSNIHGQDDGQPVTVTSSTCAMDILAELLGLFEQQLVLCLTTQQMQVLKRASINTKILNSTEVKNNVTALMKFIYNKLFAWLVRKINHSQSSLGFVPSEDSDLSFSFIGILDIFGFEILRANSFEQLCINFTNERLQQQFNEHVFITEQLLYKQEGLDFMSVSFQDNQHVIDLISKKPSGLLFILEEHGMMNRKPDDTALLNGFHQAHAVSSLPNNAYAKSRFGNTIFAIKHFAGEVQYVIDGFLSKNNDSLQDDLVQLLASSNNPFIRNVLGVGEQCSEEPGFVPHTAALMVGESSIRDSVAAGSNRDSVARPSNRVGSKRMASSATVSQQFRAQLDVLMSTLRSTTPHYIKCVKPNSAKTAELFSSEIVMQQLRYSGVLEVVRIRREGYPIRMNFLDFYSDYELLAVGLDAAKPAKDCTEEEARPIAIDMLESAIDPNLFQIGHSQIFLRDGCFSALQHALKSFLSRQATVIQNKYRTLLQRRLYVKTILRAVRLQSKVRRFCKLKQFRRIRAAVMKIQWFLAGKKMRKQFVIEYARLQEERRLNALRLKSTIKIQSVARVHLSRNMVKWLKSIMITLQLFVSSRLRARKVRARFLQTVIKIVRIQTRIRTVLATRRYKQARKNIILLQSLCRTIIAVKLAQVRFNKIIVLQSVLRMRIAAKQYAKATRALLLMQTMARGMLCFKAHRRRRKAAVLVQKNYKAHFYRVKYLKKIAYIKLCAKQLKSIVLIQTSHRKHRCRSHFIRAIKRVILLQSVVRMRRDRKEFVNVIKKVTKIQSQIRGKIAVKRRHKGMTAVVRLQSVFRGTIARSAVGVQYRAIICLQSFGRMVNAQAAYHLAFIYIVTIQTLVRKVQSMVRFRAQVRRVVKVQSLTRRFLAKRFLRIALGATICLQAFARMINAQQRYTEMLISVITVQTLVRKVQSRAKYLVTRTKIIKIQSMVRGLIRRQRYGLKLGAAVAIQSVVRMHLARQRYIWDVVRVIHLQTFTRTRLAVKAYHRNIAKIVKIQALVRQVQCRASFWVHYAAILAIQSVARMMIARNKYNMDLICVIIAQTYARKLIMQRRYRRSVQAIVTMQSLYRATKARDSVHRQLRAVLKLQTATRRYQARSHYIYVYGQIVRLQSFARMAVQSAAYKVALKAVVRLQAWNRMVHPKYRLKVTVDRVTSISKTWRAKKCLGEYRTNRRRVSRLQQCARRYLLNRRQRRDTMALHSSLLRGDFVRSSHSPDAMTVRNKWSDYCSVLHSALLGGNVSALHQLQPRYREVLEWDIRQQNSAHYLASNPNMTAVYFLAQVLNAYKYESKTAVQGLDEDDDGVDDTAGGDSSVLAFKQALAKSSTGNAVLKDGWLKKKRGGMMWQKRWFVLNEDYFIYYQSNTSISNPKFAIPLLGCTVQRLAGSQPIIELTSPAMAEKKSFFGSSNKKSITYLCESEQDLQEWLMPLRAVAGVGSLRTTAVNYINCELRQQWVSAADKNQETALHLLVKHCDTHNDAAETVKLCSWLIESGCPVYAKNRQGNTALHLAVLLDISNTELFACLVLKNTAAIDVLSVRNGSGQTVSDLVAASSGRRRTTQMEILKRFGGLSKNVTNAFLSSVSTLSNKLKGYSYLSVFFKAQSAATHTQSTLSLSVYNSKKQLIEETQDIAHPVLSATAPGGSVYWGATYHMHTPLENIESGTVLLIEFKDGSSESATSLLHYVLVPINVSTIDSACNVVWGVQSLDVGAALMGPNYRNQRNLSMLGAGGSASSKKLEVDVILHQRSRVVDVKSILSD